MFLRLRFPKYVVLNNTRMRIIYNVTLTILLVLLVTMFFSMKMWSSANKVKEFVNIHSWIELQLQTTEMVHLWDQKATQPMCNSTKNGLYNYQFDADGDWIYSNYSCPRICTSRPSVLGCFLVDELIEKTDKAMFFTTSVRESRIVNDSGVLPAREQYFHYLFPFEDVYSLDFMFNFDVNGNDLVSTRDLQFATNSLKGSSNLDTLLFVMDANGKIWRMYQPTPEGINLTVSNLLELSGQKQLLDSPQPDLGRNYLPNAQNPTGPVGRLTGVKIQSKLKCYDPTTVPSQLKLKLQSSNVNVCTLELIPTGSTWSSQYAKYPLNGNVASRTHYGIFIEFASEADLRYYDIARAMDFLTTFIVLLTLPSAFCRFFLMHCLGHLSKIYSSACDEAFSISHNVACLAMNMIAASSTYRLIADSETGISLKQMEKLLHFTLSENKELDSQEIHAFCLFSYLITQDISTGCKDAGNVKGMSDIFSSVDEIRAIIEGYQQDVIQKPAFMSTMFSSSKLTLDDVTKLFDHDRKKSMLENIFLPRFVKGEVRKERRIEKNVPNTLSSYIPYSGKLSNNPLGQLEERITKLETHCDALTRDKKTWDILDQFRNLEARMDKLAKEFGDLEHVNTEMFEWLPEHTSKVVKQELDRLHGEEGKDSTVAHDPTPESDNQQNTMAVELVETLRIRVDEQAEKLQHCMERLNKLIEDNDVSKASSPYDPAALSANMELLGAMRSEQMAKHESQPRASRTRDCTRGSHTDYDSALGSALSTPLSSPRIQGITKGKACDKVFQCAGVSRKK